MSVLLALQGGAYDDMVIWASGRAEIVRRAQVSEMRGTTAVHGASAPIVAVEGSPQGQTTPHWRVDLVSV